MNTSESIDARREAVAALSARVCFCGGPKESGFSFCGVCYHMLPRPMQHALWRKAGHGYEQAYADAKARVEQERRRPL